MPYEGSGWTLPAAEGTQWTNAQITISFHMWSGLYDPSLEKDACGVGFIVHIDGKKTHNVLVSAQELSRRWEIVIVT